MSLEPRPGLATEENAVEHREPKGVSVKRLFVLPAAVLIQMCLGGIYSWSVFVPGLRADYGLTASQTQFIFGLTFGTFTLSMLLAGRLLPTWGPRWVGLLGGLLFACGQMASSASDGRFLGLVLGYSLIGGAGIGFGYVAALTTAVQWFPRHKGLVTGVAVAGFAIGSILLATLATAWLRSGWTILEVWRAIGWAYGAVVCLGSLLLFQPPIDSRGTAVNFIAGKHLLKDPAFRVLGVGMFCGTFAGLLVIGILKPIGIACGVPPETAAKAVGALAVGNAAGRIAWGWISDRIGYSAIPGSLLFLCLTLGTLIAAGFAPVTFVVASLLVGCGFGASFVLYAAQVAARYGVREVGSVYPLLFLAYGVAGITGPLLGGLLHDWTGSYLWPIAVSAVVAAAGAWWTGRATAACSALRTAGRTETT
jgi:OFA family oxalate/formate antiporter-like MFS transporter